MSKPVVHASLLERASNLPIRQSLLAIVGTLTFILATTQAALATSSPAAGVARVDDSAVTTTGTIPTWQSCSASDECVPLAYACSFTAANRKRLSDAKAHLRAKGLDPAYFECARQDSSELQTIPQCVQARCGLWRPANTGETTGAGR